MKNILLMNKISTHGTDRFDTEKYLVSDSISDPDAIMVRSASLHDYKYEPKLRAVARAGAGVNNIPINDFAKAGIVVFNTPGANANAVKELTIAALLLASRDIVDGITWAAGLTENVAATVEKGKSKFAGVELRGKTLGVIGLGAIGGMVANTAVELGMNVVGFDPFMSVDAAWRLSSAVKKAADFDEIFRQSDFITLHTPSTEDTKGLINAESISKMRDGVRIVNIARADLVVADDIKNAVTSGKVARYVVDFPTDDMVGISGVIAIPHLGASTEESEDNCAVMAADELIDFLENGNIKNSVNYPTVVLDRGKCSRVCVMHKNIPAMISSVASKIAGRGLNIEHMQNASKGDFAYTVVDVDEKIPEEVVNECSAIDGVIRAFAIT